jgi:hypothetical protein
VVSLNFTPASNKVFRGVRLAQRRVPDEAIRERHGVFCYHNPARKSAYSGRGITPMKGIEGMPYGYLGRCLTGAEGMPEYLVPTSSQTSTVFRRVELRQNLLSLVTGRSVYQQA